MLRPPTHRLARWTTARQSAPQQSAGPPPLAPASAPAGRVEAADGRQSRYPPPLRCWHTNAKKVLWSRLALAQEGLACRSLSENTQGVAPAGTRALPSPPHINRAAREYK